MHCRCPVPRSRRHRTGPPEIQNLQFFPAETSAAELIPKMRDFSFALGVRCQHCHVGEEGQPLASFDFASDEKEAKRNARVMLAMVASINGEHMPKLAGDTSRIHVECVTCHRGTARPEQLYSLLLGVARDAGSEAALARYDALREEHHGSHTYNFAEETLALAGEALLAEQKFDAAAAFFERNLIHFPESTWTLGDLAQAEEKRGNIEAAIRAIERALELRPGHPRLTSQLEELRQAR